MIQYRWANIFGGWFNWFYHRYLSLVRYFRFRLATRYPMLDSVSQLSEATSDNHYSSKILLLENVTVVGYSRLLLKANKVAYDASHPEGSLKDIFTSYRLQEENFGLIHLNPHTMQCIFLVGLQTRVRLDGAWLSILNSSSENWMHWMSESIPRLAGMLTELRNRNCGLLVDQNLEKNMRDVLDIFARDIPRLEVAAHHAVKVSKLIVPATPTGMSAFWPRAPHPDEIPIRHDQATTHSCKNGLFNFDVSGLMHVREVMLRHFNCQPRKVKKLLILRRSYFRHITNQERIKMMLLPRGFVPVSPGEMSVEEQVMVFSEASIVVAQAGAALANIMFMPEGSKVICLSVKNPEYVNYDYFRDYAKIFSVSLEYVLGEIDDPSKYNAAHIGRATHPTNAEFSCPEEELLAMLDQFS